MWNYLQQCVGIPMNIWVLAIYLIFIFCIPQVCVSITHLFICWSGNAFHTMHSNAQKELGVVAGLLYSPLFWSHLNINFEHILCMLAFVWFCFVSDECWKSTNVRSHAFQLYLHSAKRCRVQSAHSKIPNTPSMMCACACSYTYFINDVVARSRDFQLKCKNHLALCFGFGANTDIVCLLYIRGMFDSRVFPCTVVAHCRWSCSNLNFDFRTVCGLFLIAICHVCMLLVVCWLGLPKRPTNCFHSFCIRS